MRKKTLAKYMAAHRALAQMYLHRAVNDGKTTVKSVVPAFDETAELRYLSDATFNIAYIGENHSWVRKTTDETGMVEYIAYHLLAFDP